MLDGLSHRAQFWLCVGPALDVQPNQARLKGCRPSVPSRNVAGMAELADALG